MLKAYWSYNFCFPCLSGAIQTEGLNNTVMKNDCILHSSFIPSTSSDNYRSLTTAPVLQHPRHSSDSPWFTFCLCLSGFMERILNRFVVEQSLYDSFPTYSSSSLLFDAHGGADFII